MHEPMSLTVGSVARLAGVTVRTLHHYDEIGLLSPGGRSDAGYRRYDDADLDRLQRILSSATAPPTHRPISGGSTRCCSTGSSG
jgi:hypothetical protein